jgi:hypothetical protein
MTPSKIYRDYMRWWIRLLWLDDVEAVVFGVPINSLLMDDLEALFELMFGVKPRRFAPPGYRPTRP